MMNLLKRFHDDESGATAIEYGLIAALIALAIVAAAGFLGDALVGVFEDITEELTGAT
jgi:pilus assembly protein Flp/PilA